MKLQINICYFVALVLIFDIVNGKYLLIEVDGEEKTNLKNDCKGTSCDITKNMVETIEHDFAEVGELCGYHLRRNRNATRSLRPCAEGLHCISRGGPCKPPWCAMICKGSRNCYPSCLNGGYCVGYKCECMPNFEGKACEIESELTSRTCFECMGGTSCTQQHPTTPNCCTECSCTNPNGC